MIGRHAVSRGGTFRGSFGKATTAGVRRGNVGHGRSASQGFSCGFCRRVVRSARPFVIRLRGWPPWRMMEIDHHEQRLHEPAPVFETQNLTPGNDRTRSKDRIRKATGNCGAGLDQLSELAGLAETRSGHGSLQHFDDHRLRMFLQPRSRPAGNLRSATSRFCLRRHRRRRQRTAR